MEKQHLSDKKDDFVEKEKNSEKEEELEVKVEKEQNSKEDVGTTTTSTAEGVDSRNKQPHSQIEATTSCSPSGGNESINNNASPSTSSPSFLLQPSQFVIQRGKLARGTGCSMRDWSALCRRQKEEKKNTSNEKSSHKNDADDGMDTPSSRQCILPWDPLIVDDDPYNKEQTDSNSNSSISYQKKFFLPEDVAKHNDPDDLYMVIRGVVYDVTLFQRFHPGGEMVLKQCAGKDATLLYDQFHAWVSLEVLMGKFAVGVLQLQQ